MNTKLKNNQGITLIALIITIIILVILAAVSIRAVTNMGIVGHAVNGTQDYARGTVAEKNLFDRVTELLDNTVVRINGIQDGCGITLNKDRLGLQLQGNTTVTEQLTATVVNLIGDVEWSSSDEAVAKVSDDGLITAVGLGNTVVTATVVFDGKAYIASCEVTITDVPVTSVDVTPASVTINKGGTTTLTAEVGPENVTDRTVTWTSGDAQIATVDANGVVTGVAGGTTQITATANDGSGYSAKCTVTVNVPVTGLALYKSGENANTAAASISATVEAEDTLTLVPVFTPNDASNQSITWSSNHENIATVANGVVTGVAEGTATITATANGGANVTATCQIAVTPKPIKLADAFNAGTYTWEDVHNIAKIISEDTSITKATTTTIEVNYDDAVVQITPGDIFNLTDSYNSTYRVRVLGFNTDKLASASNTNGTYTYAGTYAGISFEFVDFLKEYTTTTVTTHQMNTSNTNNNGWGVTAMRTYLNTTGVGILSNANYIKTVEKNYNLGNKQVANAATPAEDKLWLLACSEIWAKRTVTTTVNNEEVSKDYWGHCYTNESTMQGSSDSESRYAYYVTTNATYNSSNNNLKKPNTSSASSWWLRSPGFAYATDFALVDGNGGGGVNPARISFGVAPGFSI